MDCQPYNETKKKITWENCSLRKYLNSDFLYKHFNEEEKNKILLTDVINDNSKYKIKGGNNTKDKIFLLSRDEAKNYFSSKEMRVTCATSYAKSVNNELSVNSDNGNSCFWLRSPGNFLSSAAYVNSDGSVQGSGCCVDYHDYGIRPALWISD